MRSQTAARDRLRHQWLQQAEAVFELMFDADQQDQLVTFDQREERACRLTKELTTWLLEQHAAEDPAVRPADAVLPCPHCGQPARRRTPPESALPARQLTTTAGEVTLKREQWYCPKCRAAFFPSGPQAAAGNGGI
jgi:hypothetical protein